MKQITTLVRASLVAVFLLAMNQLSLAQVVPAPDATVSSPENLHVGTYNDGIPPIVGETDAVFFFKPNNTSGGTDLTLRASLVDNSSSPLTFSSYIWYQVSNSGGTETPTALSTTARDLELQGLQPGFYKYRVYGLVEDGSVICQSDEYQDIVFFILRPLDIAATPVTGTIDRYCESTPPASTDPLVFNATVGFDGTVPYQGGYANPAVGAFELTYRWYATNTASPNTQIELSTYTPTAVSNTNSLSLNDFTNLLTPGTYNIHVEVQYSNNIKDRENRGHALWSTIVGGDTPYVLTVTPQPGRPTIEIIGVAD